jgi:hypothetical protein
MTTRTTWTNTRGEDNGGSFSIWEGTHRGYHVNISARTTTGRYSDDSEYTFPVHKTAVTVFTAAGEFIGSVDPGFSGSSSHEPAITAADTLIDDWLANQERSAEAKRVERLRAALTGS